MRDESRQLGSKAVNGVGETSSHIGATSSRIIVREMRNRVRKTSSGVR
jgi:hypothetical protein